MIIPYCYCRPIQSGTFDQKGIVGLPVLIFERHGLHVFYSTLDAVNQKSLHQAMSQVTDLSRHPALSFDAFLKTSHESYGVIAFRFPTYFEHLGHLEAFLSKKKTKLYQLLNQYEDTFQHSFHLRDENLVSDKPSSPALLEGEHKGTQYLKQKYMKMLEENGETIGLQDIERCFNEVFVDRMLDIKVVSQQNYLKVHVLTKKTFLIDQTHMSALEKVLEKYKCSYLGKSPASYFATIE